MRAHGNKEFWLAALRADGPAFRAAVAEAAPDAPVPACPVWTVAQLTGHLASIYGWVAGHVGRGVTTRQEPRSREAGTATVAEFDERFGALVTLLDSLDPELPAWNWAPQSKKVAFWHRRMAHETAVHRWDAQMAVGLTEVLDTWLPAGRGTCPTHRQGMVALSAADLEQTWHIRLRPGGGVALLDTDTILDDEAPAPVLAGFERAHHRVRDLGVVPARVPPRRGVAAPHVAAGQTQPQVHPVVPAFGQAAGAAVEGHRLRLGVTQRSQVLAYRHLIPPVGAATLPDPGHAAPGGAPPRGCAPRRVLAGTPRARHPASRGAAARTPRRGSRAGDRRGVPRPGWCGRRAYRATAPPPPRAPAGPGTWPGTATRTG